MTDRVADADALRRTAPLAFVLIVIATADEEPHLYRTYADLKQLVVIADHLSPDEAYNLIATAMESTGATKPH